MNSVIAQWEDEENNRQVQFSVEYAIENSVVNVSSVTPNKISFICPDTNSCVRSIGVHTEKGRQMMTDQINGAGQVDALISELAARNGLFATV